MTKHTPKIIIVGAGLSGLTLALSLARSNFDIVVLEQASQLSEVGAGIQISANGARVRLAPGVSLDRVAARADGFSGADLANVVNEGALLAVRGSADAVTTGHLLDAVAKAQEAKRATRRRGFETLVPEAD